MDRVFSRKHRRYFQILADPRDEVQRRIILKLLAEEQAGLREECQKPVSQQPSPPPGGIIPDSRAGSSRNGWAASSESAEKLNAVGNELRQKAQKIGVTS